MNTLRSVAPVALTAVVFALTSCSPLEGGHDTESGAIAPTEVAPVGECTIAETGGNPGQSVDPEHVTVSSLTITCGGSSTDITGSFTNRTSNFYNQAQTRIRSAIVVNGEARIWHTLKHEESQCLTIQRLDETMPSKNECTVVDRNQSEPAAPVEA